MPVRAAGACPAATARHRRPRGALRSPTPPPRAGCRRLGSWGVGVAPPRRTGVGRWGAHMRGRRGGGGSGKGVRKHGVPVRSSNAPSASSTHPLPKTHARTHHPAYLHVSFHPALTRCSFPGLQCPSCRPRPCPWRRLTKFRFESSCCSWWGLPHSCFRVLVCSQRCCPSSFVSLSAPLLRVSRCPPPPPRPCLTPRTALLLWPATAAVPFRAGRLTQAPPAAHPHPAGTGRRPSLARWPGRGQAQRPAPRLRPLGGWGGCYVIHTYRARPCAWWLVARACSVPIS